MRCKLQSLLSVSLTVPATMLVYNDFRLKRYSDIRINKTRTSKVGALSKAQKAQNIIFEKTNIHSVAKYQISKKLKGDPLEEFFF